MARKKPKPVFAEMAKQMAKMPPRDELDGALTAVLSSALGGDAAALEKVVAFASRLNSEVSLLTNAHFAEMQKIAAVRTSWPVNLDPHPDWRARTDEVVQQLGVGSRTGWKPADPAKKTWSRRGLANGTVVAFLQNAAALRTAKPGCDSDLNAIHGLPDLSQSTARQWFLAMISYHGRGLPRVPAARKKKHPQDQQDEFRLCDKPKLQPLGEKRARRYGGSAAWTPELERTTRDLAHEGIKEQLRKAFERVTGTTIRIRSQ